MAEYDVSPLDNEFAAFRANLLDQVVPAGPQAVRSTVRRRRMVVTTTAALALVLTAGPAIGYAAFNSDPATPPTPAGSTDPTLAPTSSASPSPSSTSPPPSEISTPAAPDGRITKAHLLKTKVDLPPWQAGAPDFCATREVRLLDDAKQSAPTLRALTYGDADGDGALESIALVNCPSGSGEEYLQQVVVFDRDAAGRIVTLGQVNKTGSGFDWITDVEPGSPGSVRVQVADIQPCCNTPSTWAHRQWRTYGWDGQRFTQTGGPTTFGPHPKSTNLRIQTTDLVFGKPDATGKRRGTVTVTITNAGPRDADRVGITYSWGADLSPDYAAWPDCRENDRIAPEPNCFTRGLKAGASITYTFGFSVVGSPSGNGAIWVDNYGTAYQSWPDRDRGDNKATVRLRYEG
ncbi:MAG TPA: hypothetical protein VFX61_12185 [Micromonosporaceae bacterium]|nr:hypothetical protein [Micromonosporaceae bacterium]